MDDVSEGFAGCLDWSFLLFPRSHRVAGVKKCYDSFQSEYRCLGNVLLVAPSCTPFAQPPWTFCVLGRGHDLFVGIPFCDVVWCPAEIFLACLIHVLGLASGVSFILISEEVAWVEQMIEFWMIYVLSLPHVYCCRRGCCGVSQLHCLQFQVVSPNSVLE